MTTITQRAIQERLMLLDYAFSTIRIDYNGLVQNLKTNMKISFNDLFNNKSTC
ncbi:10624_t:CDS:2 [Entrophospora sp. SA101]|nr:10624_t:CDS:2 [Entrophospora sp. SA101]